MLDMRKVLFTLCICLLSCGWASAQYLPTFEFGLKAGGTLSAFPSTTNYKTTGQPGYLGGVYARFGGLGLNFQPEINPTLQHLMFRFYLVARLVMKI